MANLATRHARSATALVLILMCVGGGGWAKEFSPPHIGELAPTFAATTFDGGKVTLESLRGEVVLVNFWATWCGPCKKEIPLLDRYVRNHQGEGLRVVAVTIDAENVEPRSLKKLQEKFAFALLKTFKGDYGLIRGVLPTNYVIDRAGVLRYAHAGAFDPETLNEVVGPLLAEKGGSAVSAKPQPESLD